MIHRPASCLPPLRSGRATLIAAIALAVACALHTSPAHADIAFDVSGEVGVVQRFVRETTVPSTNLGPLFFVHGGVAVVPFVRVGVYGRLEIDPRDTPQFNRQVYGAGGFARLDSPFRTPKIVPWLRLGIGYAATHDTEDVLPPRALIATSSNAWRGHVEVPLTLGVSYKFWKPFFFSAGLGATFALPGLFGDSNPDRAALHGTLGFGYEH